MSRSAIERILDEKRSHGAGEQGEGDSRFFSLPAVETCEFFLELRMRDGEVTCFSYNDLIWFSHHPESRYLDLDFGGYTVSIKGRGLGGKLFQGIKQKKVAWVKEADSDMEDNKETEVYVEAITIEPPGTSGETAPEDTEQT